MTDEEYQQQIERIRGLMGKWRDPLGLLYWEIDNVYDRDGEDDEATGNLSTIAIADVEWDYLKARIHWYMKEVIRASDRDLEVTFVHECIHIIMEEAKPANWTLHNQKHYERVTESLARAFVWTWNTAQAACNGNEDTHSRTTVAPAE